MSILIGMEMPKSCGECQLRESWVCFAMGDNVKGFDSRDERCPLIELPPHGRLIDADALHRLFEDQWHYLQVLDWNENPTAEATQSGINWCINTMHDNAPTIIPAEEGE